MTGVVAEIWRHPIKSHGREPVDQVTLTQGQSLPWDRRWAVAHQQSRFDTASADWAPCSEFSIGSKSPSLQAIHCATDMAAGKVFLRHPEQGSLCIDPDNATDAARFIDWILPISNPQRARPVQLVRAGRAMTDTDYPSVSLINLASHRAVEEYLGQSLNPLRWRGNFLIEGLAAWAENDWIGRIVKLGDAELEIRERIKRCNATMANPETGKKDANTLAALRDGFGDQYCGVYGVVTRSGLVRQNDRIEVLT